MLTIWGPKQVGRCDGVVRRDFLKAGSLALAGLGLGDALRLRAAASPNTQPTNKKSVIIYWVDGGPSHLETYDPKPDAPAEFRGMFSPIRTNVPGILINELLTEHAKVMNHCALLRSVHHDSGDHFAGAHMMLTGYFGATGANTDPMYPSAGSIVTKLRGPNVPGLPAYVAVPHAATVGLVPGYNSGTYLGVAHNPFPAGGDPSAAGYRVPNLDLGADLTLDRLGNRRTLLTSFDRVRSAADREGVMRGLDSFNQQAFSMVTGEAARRAFDINSEDPRTRDKYGRDTYGQSALLARRLVEAGVTFVTIHNGGWDHHWDLESGLKGRLPSFDRSIAALIDDLAERGMLDDTLVLVMGEFSRTPRLNDGGNGGPPLSKGQPGRDHWGNVMSVLAAGGGVRGGQVIGASNSKGEFPVERPIRPADILATLYHIMGIDLATHFTNLAGRPVPINNGGHVISELL